MLRTPLRLLPLVGLAAATFASGLTTASPAAAAGQAVSLHSSKADRAALTLSPATKRELTRDRVSLKTTRPATRRGTSAYFPEKSGKWNFTNTTGNVTYSGVSRLTRGKRSIKLTNLSFQRAIKGKRSTATVTARVGKRKVTVFTLAGKVRVRVKGTQETITGFSATVSKTAAKLIDAALKRRVFKANQRLGSFALTLSSTVKSSGGAAGGAGAGTGGGPSALTRSGVGLSFTPAFQNALASAGLSATPLSPAADGALNALSGVDVPGTDGSSVTLPAAGGSAAGSAGFANGTLTGTVPLTGGLQLGSGQLAVNLTSPQVTLGTGTDGSTLSFSVDGGPEAQLFDLDTSQLEASATPNGELSLSGLTAELSSEGAATLNQIAGQPAFTTGQPVGGLTLIVPSGSATP
jgi:hypothetical protein